MMKWILLVSLFYQTSFAEPPKKAKSEDVKTAESFSVATLGLEAEAYRVQHLIAQGKSTYMVAKLVNGSLFLEKAIPVASYQQMKKIVQPLIKMTSNEDCKTPMRFTFRTSGQGEDQLKLCMEKSNISVPAKRFSDKAKKLLGMVERSDAETAPAPESSELEKKDEPLPE